MFQPGFKMSRTRGKLPKDILQRDSLQITYENHQQLEHKQTVQALRGGGSQDQGQPSHYPGYRGAMEPEREYSDSFKLTISSEPTTLPSGFTPLRHQQTSGQG
ncbi:hypothetical protein O181_047600 [Austropuccinia psidii MF-1]|uniref:Uncharacterized protein n=1 Tax=Austropuccinia psidii MF-1 TaxID=1389203 RepID=A0A9Q3DQH5_9BASI|nr:hypothetical protein [Austropuccinia psidii MF-1]